MREPRRATVEAAPFVQHSRARKSPPCPCRCGTVGFCSEHKERLAQIKAEMQGELKILGQYGQRSDQRKKKRPPTCCNPACWEPRPRGERYCASCRDAGWVEDE